MRAIQPLQRPIPWPGPRPGWSTPLPSLPSQPPPEIRGSAKWQLGSLIHRSQLILKQNRLLAGSALVIGLALFAVKSSWDPENHPTDQERLLAPGVEEDIQVDDLETPGSDQSSRIDHSSAVEPTAKYEMPLPTEETPLDVAKREISEQVDISLDGIVEINRLIDQLTLIAELPIDSEVDYDFEDSDAVAYKVLGTPDGMDAHFLVGLESFERDGKRFKAYELEVQIGGDDVTFERGAMREGPRVRMLMDFDEDGNPGMMGLVATRRVSLGLSRQAGINAYEGEYVNGISYKGSATIPEDNMSETFGVQNGRVVTSVTSPSYSNSIKPLLGDVMIEPEKARLLFSHLQSNFSSLSNKK